MTEHTAPRPEDAPPPTTEPGTAPPTVPDTPPRARRRPGRAVTAAVLVGVLLVGGGGGFAVGRATAPEPTGPGQLRDGPPDGEMPQPPSDRSGGDTSDQDSGSAADGTTDDTSATT